MAKEDKDYTGTEDYYMNNEGNMELAQGPKDQPIGPKTIVLEFNMMNEDDMGAWKLYEAAPTMHKALADISEMFRDREQYEDVPTDRYEELIHLRGRFIDILNNNGIDIYE